MILLASSSGHGSASDSDKLSDIAIPEHSLYCEIAILMSLSEVHRRWHFEDFWRLTAPPVNASQYFGFVGSQGLEGWFTWGNLTAEAERGLHDGARLLQPVDWTAGDFSRIWIIDGLAPFGGLPSMARAIRARLSLLAKENGWPAHSARWRRTFGSGRTIHVGEVSSATLD